MFCQCGVSTSPEAGNDISQDILPITSRVKASQPQWQRWQKCLKGSSFKPFSQLLAMSVKSNPSLPPNPRLHFPQRRQLLQTSLPAPPSNSPSVSFIFAMLLKTDTLGDFPLGGFFPWVLTQTLTLKLLAFVLLAFSDSASAHLDCHLPGSSCKYVSANFYSKSHGVLVVGDYCWFQFSAECGFRKTRL